MKTTLKFYKDTFDFEQDDIVVDCLTFLNMTKDYVVDFDLFDEDCYENNIIETN